VFRQTDKIAQKSIAARAAADIENSATLRAILAIFNAVHLHDIRETLVCTT